MTNVTLTFTGQDSDKMAQEFYTWLVDGGLEDEVVDTLTEKGPAAVDMIEIDNEKLQVVFGCSYQDKN